MRKRAFYKDIFRTLKNNLSRFIAIVMMTALGIGVFTGFAAGCMDVFDSADHFYDKQKTYDIKIVSTLGLTSEDLTAVSKLENVSAVFGNCSMEVLTTQKDGKRFLANLSSLDSKGMNEPYVLKGKLPVKSGEIAVNKKFIKDTGLHLGDTITLEKSTESKTAVTNDATSSKKSVAVTDDATSSKKSDDDTDDATSSKKADDESEVDISADDISADVEMDGPALEVTKYKITAIILSPLSISNSEGSLKAASISSSSSDYLMYVTKDCIRSDVYTAIYLTLNGAAELDCYSTEYQALVNDTISTIEDTVQDNREKARYEEVVGIARSKLDDAEQELQDKMAEAEQKFADAQAKIDDGWNSYRDGLAELKVNRNKLNDGQQALNDAKKSTNEKFIAAQKKMDEKSEELKDGEEKLVRREADAFDKFTTYEQQLNKSREELIKQKSEADEQLTKAVAALKTKAQEIWNSEATQKLWSDMISDGVSAAPYLLAVKQGDAPTAEQTDAYNHAMDKLQSDTKALAVKYAADGSPLSEEQTKNFSGMAVNQGTLNYSQTMLDKKASLLETQKTEALKQISDARKKVNEGKSKLLSGQMELDLKKTEAIKQLEEKQAEFARGMQELEEGKKKLEDAKADLTKGQNKLNKNKSKYQSSISKAKQKLNDAKKEIADINAAEWYVWDRSENDSFDGLNNDISFIQAVTKAFPIIFFVVAILVCLTTMTRMVEEDRTLIGTYKSLGYTKHLISMKYIIYAGLACVIGGIFGTVIGFLGLPKVISIIVETMYVLPTVQFSYYPAYGLSGFGMFLIGIVGATIYACAEMLHIRPAGLMRPKAPKEGSRILLERIPFLWKRLKFLNKVTCRNLFRYKKRAIMTIVGILGCTMLIILGFGVRDTVNGVILDQYGKVTVYDGIVVTNNLDTKEMDQLFREIKEAAVVKEKLQLQISTLTLRSSNDNLDITVMVIPDGADFNTYVHLKDIETNREMSLSTTGIVVTQSAAKQLKLKKGDTVFMQNKDNLEYEFPVSFVTANNMGNYVYLSESCYQAAFGDYAGTSLLLKWSDKSKGEIWLDRLSEDDRILSVSSSQDAIDTFSGVKNIVNMVVYLLISMSAVLAFTVLFTLSNINVSERERELATIKVLGFYRKEVYSYVNKETFILTLIGILLGLPAGYGITYAILSNVTMAGISFNVRVSVAAYLSATILTIVFTLMVNKITNKALRKINMVEALKSVE